jgi:hypothetical protein
LQRIIKVGPLSRPIGQKEPPPRSLYSARFGFAIGIGEIHCAQKENQKQKAVF